MNEPRVVESVTNECQSLGRAHESSSARAEQLIACLEGEIAKRDETIARLEPQLNRAIQANYDLREELAACRVAVENCELFRARIVELESQYQRDVYGLNNEGDPIGGDPAGGYANDNARLRAELSALKAQEPAGYIPVERKFLEEIADSLDYDVRDVRDKVRSLLAAPVSAGADGLEVVQAVAWLNTTTREATTHPVVVMDWDDDKELVESLMTISKHEAIIDGLRGEVAALRSMLATVSKAGLRGRTERDQQAQRIGELEGLLRSCLPALSDGGCAALANRIAATLSAGKDAAP